jgi:hypothetical protein
MPRGEISRAMRLGLRAGDWVKVRPAEEILATLDRNARLDGLPFQPEMLAFCGRRLQVAKVAHKTCDSTPHRAGGRRMYDTVHLRDARCDGSAHDGCQADCVFFWKEAWLTRADSRSPPTVTTSGGSCSERDVVDACKTADSDPSDPVWVCQTTAIYEASDTLRWWDMRQYVRDVTSGNHTARHMCKLLLLAGYRKLVGLGVGYRALVAFYDKLARVLRADPFPTIEGRIADGTPTPADKLDLQPGEWVEVKSRDEIAATITPAGFNRGMRYDVEMLKYSGKRYRVQMRVDKLINEKNGKMSRMKTPSIQLENVYCRAECTATRLGCPRASNTYWREIWLKRCDVPLASPERSSE